MSEGSIEWALVADSSDGFAKVKSLQDAINQQARDWQIQRNKLMREIREGFMLVSSLMMSFRQVMGIIGAQIDPFFSALVGLVLSTTSMLISSATVLAATGIGGVAAAIMFGIAISFNILSLAKLADDQFKISEQMRTIKLAVQAQRRAAPGRATFGGAFRVG